ncbi:2-hydroxychromene-2-carboxylate isomerase [Streptomyces sp. NPDC018045]|uniref:2-hydroxychromene-2-carboxylate isomerase n=1 Tax=Streptomyces sp. NPDC018045 TaxID=3365037 RepID=UPI0037ACB4B5
MKPPPRLYFSLRSPFSWMALRRLEKLYPQAREHIDHRPFWEPGQQITEELTARGHGFHYAQMSRAKHRYILQDTRRLATRLGYRMVWPVDGPCPWWDLPHLAWLKARHIGRHHEAYVLMAAARWERGEDICDAVTLRQALAAGGEELAVLVEAVHDPQIRAEAVDALATAYDDEVFGIPYFAVGWHRFWGLDRVEDFAAELAGQQPSAPTGPDVHTGPAGPDERTVPLTAPPHQLLDRLGAYDSDTAGGCG